MSQLLRCARLSLARGARLDPHARIIIFGEGMTERREHWVSVYTTKQPDEVSWFQREPRISLELLAEAGLAASS